MEKLSKIKMMYANHCTNKELQWLKLTNCCVMNISSTVTSSTLAVLAVVIFLLNPSSSHEGFMTFCLLRIGTHMHKKWRVQIRTHAGTQTVYSVLMHAWIHIFAVTQTHMQNGFLLAGHHWRFLLVCVILKTKECMSIHYTSIDYTSCFTDNRSQQPFSTWVKNQLIKHSNNECSAATCCS